jgi:tRNA pseudouridine65 synthase
LPSDLILYQDEDLLVVNKPVGVPVHGSRILEGHPQTLLRQVRQETGSPVHAVHRLDRPVSGAILLTRDRACLAKMSRAFEERRILKNYLAVARGWTEDAGSIDHPLGPVREDRKEGSSARPAVTRFSTLARAELPIAVKPYASSRYSLLLLQPETGRRHQLRRHMKHQSHHLVGDTTYGKGEHNRMFRDHFACSRLLLHAWSLEFEHPENARTVRVNAPLDAAFESVIRQLGWGGDWARWKGEQRFKARS